VLSQRFDVDNLYRGEQFDEDMRRQQEQSTKAIENAAWTRDKAGPSNEADRSVSSCLLSLPWTSLTSIAEAGESDQARGSNEEAPAT
jgi:hypothetical protein